MAGGSILAGLDGANYVLQSSQFGSVLSNLTVPKYVYLGIAVFGLVTFLMHGREQH